jgi:hypothetical protein
MGLGQQVAFRGGPGFPVGGPVPAPARVDAPLWFQRMDSNGDGDVTLTEFLGPRQVFDRIDADGDEMISPEEARRGDRLFRPQNAPKR